MKIVFRLGAVLCFAILLNACSNAVRKGGDGGYYQDDGPPRYDKIDITSIPDAIPRDEPRSTTGNRPYQALGQHYQPVASAAGFRQQGYASWYGRKFHGRRTSSGEAYDMYAMTAAHPTLPLPTYVRVRHLRNQREVTVKVNDRGPFLHNRIIDLSYAAAKKLGIVATGTGLVEIEAVFPNSSPDGRVKLAKTNIGQEQTAFIQAGAFADIRKAHHLRDRLIADGMTKVAIEPLDIDGRRLYRVRVGPYPTTTEARNQIPQVAHLSGGEPRLIINRP